MKKKYLIIISVLFTLLFSCMVSAASFYMYVNRDSINVYRERDTDSRVIKKYKGGDRLLIEEERGSWYGVLIKTNDSQMLGWVRAKLLTDTMPRKYCTHKWSAWWTVREATCTSSGEASRSCSVCGKIQTKTLKKTGHRYDGWTVLRSATCVNEGSKMRRCRVCGHEQWRTIKKAAHSYGSWQITKKATCTEEGSRKRTCRVCGHNQRETIAKKPHSYQWKIVIAATDHSSGQKSQICKVCNHRGETQWFDPKGTLRRGYSNSDVAKMQQLLIENGFLNDGAADGVFGSGTESALIRFQLERGLTPDGVGWPQTLKRLRHEYGEWTFIRKITRDEDGIRERTCIECGYKQQETVAAEPSVCRGDRNEAVRKIQIILNQLGADAGAEDGIYGQKLDDAYGKIAGEENKLFVPGRLYPSDIDLLFNKWVRMAGHEEWISKDDADRTVITAFTVRVVKTQKNTITYEYSATNLGRNACTLDAVLLSFANYPTFRWKNLVLSVRDSVLRPGHENTVTGTFTIRRSMAEGQMKICALTTEAETGKKVLSNMIVRDDFAE